MPFPITEVLLRRPYHVMISWVFYCSVFNYHFSEFGKANWSIISVLKLLLKIDATSYEWGKNFIRVEKR